MNKFTMDNTEGFNEKILQEMNEELAKMLFENNVQDDDDTLQKHYAEVVFNKYC